MAFGEMAKNTMATKMNTFLDGDAAEQGTESTVHWLKKIQALLLATLGLGDWPPLVSRYSKSLYFWTCHTGRLPSSLSRRREYATIALSYWY